MVGAGLTKASAVSDRPSASHKFNQLVPSKKCMHSISVLYTIAPGRGVRAFICWVLILVITKTRLLLSSSKTDKASMFCGLSPIFIWPSRILQQHRPTRVIRNFIFSSVIKFLFLRSGFSLLESHLRDLVVPSELQ